MRLDPAGREYAHLRVTVNVDPTALAVHVSLRGGPFIAWDWTGPAVEAPVGEWTRTVRKLLAGPDADGTDALVLGLGDHTCRWKLVGSAPEEPVRDGETIEVR